MTEFVIEKTKRIGYFKTLRDEFDTPNLITYDNKIWGNMNPYFAQDKKEKRKIEEKDRKIREILGIERSLSLTTPPENTFLEINNRVLGTLFFKKDDTSIPIRANGVVVSEKLDNQIGVVVAPKDCAVVVMKSEQTDVSVVIHIGAPQIQQGLHKQVISYLKTLVDDLDSYFVYVFPHITVKNYKLSDEKRDRLDSSLIKYLGEDNYFDFMLAFKEYLTELGITRFVDSGIDSYEAAKNGNMYSHTLEKELEKKDEFLKKGAHNVVIKI